MCRILSVCFLVMMLSTALVYAHDSGQLSASDGAGLVRRALDAGNIAALARILEQQPGLANHIYEDGLSPVHVAVMLRSSSAVRLLLERRADVNRQLGAIAFHDRQREGATALHLAVSANSPEIVRMLAAAGANQSLRDGMGRTPFVLARALNFRQVVTELRRVGAASFQEHIKAAMQGDAESLRADLDAHPDYLRARDQNGLRAIDYAVRNGRPEAVSILLAAGITASDRDALGNTLLHLACWEGQATIIRLLLDAGFSADLLANGATPLQVAAAEGRLECARILLESGANPSLIALDGQTAAGLARARGHLQTADLIESFIRQKSPR